MEVSCTPARSATSAIRSPSRPCVPRSANVASRTAVRTRAERPPGRRFTSGSPMPPTLTQVLLLFVPVGPHTSNASRLDFEELPMPIDRDVAVPTRDGSPVVVDVFRPEGDGPFPVIASVSPYGKDVHWPERYPLYEVVPQNEQMV